MQSVTTPDDWRRRAQLAVQWLRASIRDATPRFAPSTVDVPEAVWHIEEAARVGLVMLESGEAAVELCARVAARIALDQPDDALGIVVALDVDNNLLPEWLVPAHAGPTDVAGIGMAVFFLARYFEETGEEEALDAAIELHDLAVALGEGIWETLGCGVLGLGASELYAITGEDAFLATAERAADVVCEAQSTAGLIGRSEAQTAQGALVLSSMAEAVEVRLAAAIDEEPEAEGHGGGGHDG